LGFCLPRGCFFDAKSACAGGLCCRRAQAGHHFMNIPCFSDGFPAVVSFSASGETAELFESRFVRQKNRRTEISGGLFYILWYFCLCFLPAFSSKRNVSVDRRLPIGCLSHGFISKKRKPHIGLYGFRSNFILSHRCIHFLICFIIEILFPSASFTA